LIKELLKPYSVLKIDLLLAHDEEKFGQNPDALIDIFATSSSLEWIIIDEIQKYPKLLDVIHYLIEEKKVTTKFALTGSSARKLKRGAANLLAGRLFTNHLYPLTFIELKENFSLSKALNFGTLPHIFNNQEDLLNIEYLRSYVETYVKEEVWLEQIIKDLTPFRKFLEIAAQMNGEILNFTKIGTQINVDHKTVINYFSILEDTLSGLKLEAFHTSVRKRVIKSPKFYFFDLGVKKALERNLTVEVKPHLFQYGKHFEAFIITQCHFLNSYYRKDFQFTYLKSGDGAEIDLIIERPGESLVLIEIKSSLSVLTTDLSALEGYLPQFPNATAYCWSQDNLKKEKGGIKYRLWSDGIREVFNIPMKA
jgi:predicted AAA+ superfamily ATPase